VAELLGDWTQENDPHPALFDEAVATLGELTGEVGVARRVLRFELVFLGELGYRPLLDRCAGCAAAVAGSLSFSATAGGVLCPRCRGSHPEAQSLSSPALEVLRDLARSGDDWRRSWPVGVAAELRALVGGYVTYLRGRPPRLLPYLGS
jgi:DNA repair protein RecO (recombination protein O)